MVSKNLCFSFSLIRHLIAGKPQNIAVLQVVKFRSAAILKCRSACEIEHDLGIIALKVIFLSSNSFKIHSKLESSDAISGKLFGSSVAYNKLF